MEAAERLWDRYYRQLTALAKRQLDSSKGRVADEEDVVVSVFDTLFRGIQEGRFSQLRDRSDLLCILIAITRQKVANVGRREGCQKRGGGRTRNESQLQGDTTVGFSLDTLCREEPTPDFLAAFNEEHARLMATLPDRNLRQIATWTLEGYSALEIAEKLGVSARTIQRKLLLIRTIWSQEL